MIKIVLLSIASFLFFQNISFADCPDLDKEGGKEVYFTKRIVLDEFYQDRPDDLEEYKKDANGYLKICIEGIDKTDDKVEQLRQFLADYKLDLKESEAQEEKDKDKEAEIQTQEAEIQAQEDEDKKIRDFLGDDILNKTKEINKIAAELHAYDTGENLKAGEPTADDVRNKVNSLGRVNGFLQNPSLRADWQDADEMYQQWRDNGLSSVITEIKKEWKKINFKKDETIKKEELEAIDYRFDALADKTSIVDFTTELTEILEQEIVTREEAKKETQGMKDFTRNKVEEFEEISKWDTKRLTKSQIETYLKYADNSKRKTTIDDSDGQKVAENVFVVDKNFCSQKKSVETHKLCFRKQNGRPLLGGLKRVGRPTGNQKCRQWRSLRSNLQFSNYK